MADAETNNNVNEEGGLGRDTFSTVQDRLLQTIFFRITLAYARGCPKFIRRLFETLILLKAVLCFFILIYVHVTFTRTPDRCLGNISDSWPRDGILRVEIMREAPPGYSLTQSYEKERKLSLRHRQNDELFTLFRFLTGNGFLDDYLYGYPEKPTQKTSDLDISNDKQTNPSNSTEDIEEALQHVDNSSDYDDLLLEQFHNDIIWPDEEYIFEYSSEHGFLRLPPATREKLNITVKLVVLDPQRNSCFGDSFSQFFLQNFLGYDDVLISSIKSLAKHEDNKGYLRNVVTSAHYHFVSRWTSSSSYFLAALVMMAFTISISTLSRYSQHQIFVFIMELLQRLEFNTAVTFQAAPLLTEILAFVGMEAIMSEFFEDTTTAFYVILIVWIADQYDAICCRTAITKKFWLKFFYLYHLSFYAYHYRFNGQYSGLALVTMWLFTQHSMIYFFHHYELPMILQQAQIQDIFLRNSGIIGGAQTFRIERASPQHQQPVNANNNNGNVNNGNNMQGPFLRRMRGLDFGGLRLRFGVVFQTNLRQPEQPPQEQPQRFSETSQQQQQQPHESPSEASISSEEPSVDHQNPSETNVSNDQATTLLASRSEDSNLTDEICDNSSSWQEIDEPQEQQSG